MQSLASNCRGGRVPVRSGKPPHRAAVIRLGSGLAPRGHTSPQKADVEYLESSHDFKSKNASERPSCWEIDIREWMGVWHQVA